MTENKLTIERYIDGFNRNDHGQILSCLTTEIVWEIPGFFRLMGKNAFDQAIENDEFVGSPEISISRMVEENNVVVAEGRIRSERKSGGTMDAVFCDVFRMRNAKIDHVTSYLAQTDRNAPGAPA